jgi:hypothetical protein
VWAGEQQLDEAQPGGISEGGAKASGALDGGVVEQLVVMGRVVGLIAGSLVGLVGLVAYVGLVVSVVM